MISLRFIFKGNACILLTALILVYVTGCDTLYVRRNKAHRFATDFKGTYAAVVDIYEAKVGGTLFYIEKSDGRWKLKQTIGLYDILVDHSPLAVECNDNWIVLTSIPRNRGDKAKIVLFKKTDTKWGLVPTPACMSDFKFYPVIYGCSEPYKSIALSNDNQLFIAQDEHEQGKVFRFDLNATPISLKETIRPPEDNFFRSANGDGFGFRLFLENDIMVIQDAGVAFSTDEIRQYGLTNDDLDGSRVNGVLRPVNRTSILAYKLNRKEDRWEFVTDFYKQLPHPPGGILRKPVASSNNAKNSKQIHWFERVDFFWTTNSNRIILSTSSMFYPFKTEDGSSWQLDNQFVPHPRIDDKRASLEVGEKYSTIFDYGTGCFEVYPSEGLETGKRLWEIALDTQHIPNIEKYPRVKYAAKFKIVDNSIFAYYLLRTHNPDTVATSTVGRVVIYDIDDKGGPKESFCMELPVCDGLVVRDCAAH